MPDQDEIARSAPKSAPPQVTSVSGAEQFQGSVESEGTLRSSSVSQPLGPTLHSEGVAEGEGEEGGMESEPSTTSVERTQDQFFEEVAESHIVLMSRYISDDQVSRGLALFVC